MIEYYTLMHKGGEAHYRDNYYMNYGKTITVLLVFVSKSDTDVLDNTESLDLSKIIASCNNKSFKSISDDVSSVIKSKYDYLVLQINDEMINLEKHGSIAVYIVKRGELQVLPNGLFSLEDDDRIVCATSNFYKNISEVEILVDAVSSISSEEWLDNMTIRIAENSHFSDKNLTAATFIVRKDD